MTILLNGLTFYGQEIDIFVNEWIWFCLHRDRFHSLTCHFEVNVEIPNYISGAWSLQNPFYARQLFAVIVLSADCSTCALKLAAIYYQLQINAKLEMTDTFSLFEVSSWNYTPYPQQRILRSSQIGITFSQIDWLRMPLHTLDLDFANCSFFSWIACVLEEDNIMSYILRGLWKSNCQRLKTMLHILRNWRDLAEIDAMLKHWHSFVDQAGYGRISVGSG